MILLAIPRIDMAAQRRAGQHTGGSTAAPTGRELPSSDPMLAPAPDPLPPSSPSDAHSLTRHPCLALTSVSASHRNRALLAHRHSTPGLLPTRGGAQCSSKYCSRCPWMSTLRSLANGCTTVSTERSCSSTSSSAGRDMLVILGEPAASSRAAGIDELGRGMRHGRLLARRAGVRGGGHAHERREGGDATTGPRLPPPLHRAHPCFPRPSCIGWRADGLSRGAGAHARGASGGGLAPWVMARSAFRCSAICGSSNVCGC